MSHAAAAAPTRPSTRPSIRTVFGSWLDTAVRPRLLIARLIPHAGGPLVAAVLAVNILLGLLPVAFVLATSVVIGQVPAAVRDGVDSAAWSSLVTTFLLATAAFLGQQSLAPVQSALNVRMRRVVDARVLDDILGSALETVSIGPMEDPATLDLLDEAKTPFEKDFSTPGDACGGLLALVGRYLRLIALAVVVAVALSWWAGLALVAATMTFRYGQRGGLRKYSQVWRDVVPVRRRSVYLRETAMGEGAAKESRIYGLTPWLSDRFAEAHLTMWGAIAVRRRQVYLTPYLAYTAIGLALASFVLVSAALAGARGEIGLTALALVLQSVMTGLLLGQHYVESDVQTQFGMLSVRATARLRERVDEVAAAGEVDLAGLVGARGTVDLPPGAPHSSLRLDGVGFAYPGGGAPVLDRIDLELPAGRSTAIVGVNGAGKTTMVKLLTRLYDPSAGRILADGVDIRTVDPARWRRQVSVIFQDFVRYEFSAADNIALGAAHVPRDDDAVRLAAARAGILDVFEALPLGLDTPLARGYPGGVDLSGGQWQRIAIARALYALDAGATVLVLDEPTAALDVRAEAAFFDQFVELTRGVTSLLISHRFSSVRRADHIVVLAAGRVAEQGSHDELMAHGGHYAELFLLQAERFSAGLDAEGDDDLPDDLPDDEAAVTIPGGPR